MAEVNCYPLSDLTVAGTPNLDTQLDEHIGTSGSLYVRHWGRLYSPCTSVYHREQVTMTQGGGQQAPHQVHMDVTEPLSRVGDGY
jgi:hypothetical protein